MNLSLVQVDGSILLISQFTLCAELNKGKKPSFARAIEKNQAKVLYNYFIEMLKRKSIKYETGKFGANMNVSLLNEGPFTLVLNSNMH